jgi:hypothetical protein
VSRVSDTQFATVVSDSQTLNVRLSICNCRTLAREQVEIPATAQAPKEEEEPPAPEPFEYIEE